MCRSSAPGEHEQLIAIADPFAQSTRRSIQHRADFVRGVAADGDVCRDEGPEELQLEPVPIDGGLQRFEQRKSHGEVGDGLDVGRSTAGAKSRFEPELDAPRRQPCCREVMREQLGSVSAACGNRSSRVSAMRRW